MAAPYVLIRQPSTSGGTLGEILDPSGAHLCYTCERPWLDNAAEVSCIPAGVYTCVPHDSPKHPDTWELQDVPERTEILLHNGNTEKDSEGCIIVGSEQGTLGGLPAVLNSVATLNKLRQVLPDEFTIEVRWAAPLAT